MAIVMLMGAENPSGAIPPLTEPWHFFSATRRNAFRGKGERTRASPSSQWETMREQSSEQTQDQTPRCRKATLWVTPPRSRPRLLRPRGSCHAKGCACTDVVDTGTPHAGDRVMPSPRATRNCTLQPYGIWAEQRRTVSPEDREREGG